MRVYITTLKILSGLQYLNDKVNIGVVSFLLLSFMCDAAIICEDVALIMEKE